jgi:hypothetical protein
MGDQGRCRNDGRRTTELLKESLTPLGMTLLINHGGDRRTGKRQDGRQSTRA